MLYFKQLVTKCQLKFYSQSEDTLTCSAILPSYITVHQLKIAYKLLVHLCKDRLGLLLLYNQGWANILRLSSIAYNLKFLT